MPAIEFDQDQLKSALEEFSLKAKKYLSDEGEFEKLVQRLEHKLKIVPGLGNSLSDIACLVSLSRSYIVGEYTDIPVGTATAAVAAIVYIVSPIDLIPDFIPGAGIIDDAAMVALVLHFISSDVEEYKEWRKANGKQLVDEL